MKANEETVKVFHKENGIPREFTKTQWEMLGVKGRKAFRVGTPPEAEDKLVSAAAVPSPSAAILPQTDEAKIQAGVEAALQKLGLAKPQTEEERIQAAVEERLRGMGIDPAQLKDKQPEDGQKQSEGREGKEPDPLTNADKQKVADVTAEAGDKKSVNTGTDAADDVDETRNNVVGNQPDNVAPELAEARTKYELLYPGRKAGNKLLATLQEAIRQKEAEGGN